MFEKFLESSEVVYIISLLESFITYVMDPNIISQLLLIVVTLVLGSLLAQNPTVRLKNFFHQRWSEDTLSNHNEEAIISLVYPAMILVIQVAMLLVSELTGTESHLIFVAAQLLLAWVVIRFFTALIRYPLWSRIIASIVWLVVALNILGAMEWMVQTLDGYSFVIGSWKISPLIITKGIVSLIILLWIAGLVARFLDAQISRLPNLTPSVRVLLSKVSKIVLIIVAVLIGLETLGIDLTALTVLGGAVGLGLGFGLQKVVSNLVSGMILLLDRSVKPGDVIEVGESFGWVNSLGARYVSVLTRDGVEHLIPNEHLITEKVVNWSHSSSKVRLKIPVGVSYDTDVRRAMDLCLDAVHECERVLPSPVPVCRLMEFGDSSVNLEIRVWIDDPVQGVANVRSDILLSIWDKFQEHKVGIPYPQRDIHIRSYVDESAITTTAPAKKKGTAAKKEK